MNNIIITYGLSKDQTSLLKAALSEEYELTTSECVTDLIVTDAVCTVIDPQNMGEDALRSLLAYYMDVGDRLDETVVWLGKVELPNLPSFVRCDDFLQLLLSCKDIVSKARRDVGYSIRVHELFPNAFPLPRNVLSGFLAKVCEEDI